jgi:serine phosphatase RsbU (regulator of sigma subunit)
LLVAYSDGLVERRGEELRDGLNRLADALRDKAGWSPERVCDHLLEAMGVSQTHRDDVVVVVVSYKPGLVAS